MSLVWYGLSRADKTKDGEENVLSYKNTQEQIEESGVDTVVIPLGSVEQHGSHLPIGTDCFTAQAVAEGVAQHFNALLMPVLPISTCYEHKGKKGSFWMRPITYYQMLEDVILCMYEQGFKKVFLIVGHGGIFIADPVVRELNALHDDLLVVKASAPRPDFLENTEPELHAGENETSLILHLYEELVDVEKAKQNDSQPSVPQEFLNYAPLPVLSKTGVWGKPSLASKEKGEKLLRFRIDACIKFIEDALKIAVEKAW